MKTGSAVIRRRAPAKLNLSLDVLGLRDDGYHEIRSVVQTISLVDHLVLEKAEDLAVESPIAPPEEDLVFRAARLLQEASGTHLGARIRLWKGIPVGAGLGGGSSDAAQTLLGLRALWKLDLTHKDLMAVAARLGSDVPFFLTGGTALMEGRGERLRSLPPLTGQVFVVFKPDRSLATADVYRRAAAGDGTRTERLLASLEQGRLEPSGNDLESPARELLPELDGVFEALRPLPAQITGSGSALFVRVRHAREAAHLACRLGPRLFTRVVSAVEEMPEGRANASMVGRGSTLVD